MAVAWRKATTPSLDSQRWRVFAVNGQEYLIKALFDDQGYYVMVSDLSTVWEEDAGAEEILSRGKSLNPSVEVPLSVLLSNLSTKLDGAPSNVSFTISPDSSLLDFASTLAPDTLTLTLKTILSSLPFKWEFFCCKAPPKAISIHLVRPLLCMVGELQRRQLELNELLIKKDKEIQDYKDQGTFVSRRYLETAPFDAKAFANEMITSSNFEITTQRPLAVFSDPAFQELYGDIALVQKYAETEKKEVVSDFGYATSGTWASEIPVSLLPAVPSTSHPISPTTTNPPEKSITTDREMLSEDSEQERREALKRKLEEKSKAKKKKKILI